MVFVALSTGEADLPSRLAPSFPGKLAGAQAIRNHANEIALRYDLSRLEFFCMRPFSREISALARIVFK